MKTTGRVIVRVRGKNGSRDRWNYRWGDKWKESGRDVSRPFRGRERHVRPQNGRVATFARRALFCLYRVGQRLF